MAPDLLRHLATVGAASIHPHGRPATAALLDRLDRHRLPAGSRVLEMGCGTGETCLALAERGLEVVALDRSWPMLVTARRRLRSAGLSSPPLPVHATASRLPFPDGSLPAVVCESVLAINARAAIARILAEVERVLRPGGVLLVNEALWRSGTSLAMVAEVNEACERDFGMIQATGELIGVDSWCDLLARSGLTVLAADPLAEAVASAAPRAATPVRRRSRVFTLVTKLRAFARPRRLAEHLRLRRLVARHHEVGRCLDARLFWAVKGPAPSDQKVSRSPKLVRQRSIGSDASKAR